MKAPLVALLSDFGTRDWYVAAIKGGILSRAPSARLIDITHEIPPQDVVAGAFTLAAAVPWFPPGTVFMAVVDPGVGSHRALLAARADSRYFVGPDNGLLTLSFERARQLSIVRLANPRYWLQTVSRTFQGRDVMAPVATHLARGGSLAQLGIPIHRIAKLTFPPIQRRGRRVEGRIVHIDAFGNLITNLPGTLLAQTASASPPLIRYKGRAARVVLSYADGRPNELVAVVDSLGLIELAIREGSAAWVLNAKRDEKVDLLSSYSE